MIIKLSAFPFAVITVLFGMMADSANATPPIATHSTGEFRLDRWQYQLPNLPVPLYGQASGEQLRPTNDFEPRVYRVRDDHPPQNRPSSPAKRPKAGDSKKSLFDQLQQQLTSKDDEIAELREKLFVANELLTVEQRHVGSLETQLVQKERELTVLRDQGHSTSTTPKESDTSKNNLQQTKLKTDDAERQLLASNLETAKRRIGELILQLYAKESELSGLRATAFDSTKQLRAELEAQTEELQQAKRRIVDLEQQAPVVKTHELAQAKRRIADLELQTASKEQELAQTQRRVAEVEQQIVGKEQALAKTTDDFRQVSQKLEELHPQLIARTAELARTKQLVADLERNSFTIVDPTTTPVPDTDTANRKVAETDLPLPTVPSPHSTSTSDADAGGSDLGKVSERLARLLQPELTKGTVALRRRGNKLTLAFAPGALFSPGEAMMTLGGTTLLERVGSVLRGFRYQSIEVTTNPNNQPTPTAPGKSSQDNTGLSNMRAERASQTLINGGIEADRVKAVSSTPSKPTSTNEPEKDRSKNQKVEIVIVSESEPITAPNAIPSRSNKKPQPLSTEKVSTIGGKQN